MNHQENQLTTELSHRLKDSVAGDVLCDPYSRGRYATDASVYQMLPHAVVVPKNYDDVRACLAAARDLSIPVLPRGGGTSQCGQTVNHALVIDNTKYLNKLLELDVENKTCVVEPGIILDELNRQLAPHGLWYPVDVSTASRASIGGMLANNSCGQRSIYYGKMRDNVLALDAILADQSEWHFGPVDPDNISLLSPSQQKHYRSLFDIGSRYKNLIAEKFPKVQRRVGGYNIDALTTPDCNMAHVLVGSEGTLAYSKNIQLKLWPLPVNKVLGVCHFPTFYQAMDAAQHLVKLNPRAVELIDSTMIQLARDIDLFKPAVEQFVRGEPAAVLLVEFAFDDQDENIRHLQHLQQCMSDLGYSWQGDKNQWGGVVEAVDKHIQSAIAEVRKAGLNIMMSMKSQGKPVSFVEDCAVDLKDLAEYTRSLTEIFQKYGTEGTWYAHASVGCLHVRPVLNLKLDKDAETMRAIADEAFDLVLQYKGSHSGEHGDGISRSEFHEKMFGPDLVRAFKEVKNLFDPEALFNPGKIVNAPRMNERSLLRYHNDYQPQARQSVLHWSDWGDRSQGFQGAVEMCNNNGACRKLKGGAMCPSYRVTKNEKDVTRGRANSLRLAISGQLGDNALASVQMRESMKLCVSCKACKRECPTGVDMAKMKIEVLAAHADTHGFSMHDQLIAQLPRYAFWAAKFPAIANLRNQVPFIARSLENLSGFSASRQLPAFRSDWFNELQPQGQGEREVVLLADTFNTWFEPDNLRSAVSVLIAAGYRVNIAQAAESGQRKRLCCGRTWLSVGMIKQARREVQRMSDALLPYARKGVPIIGLEPSCLLTLRDEHLSLLPGDASQLIAEHAFLFEEFIASEIESGQFNPPEFKATASKVLLHGHCHQKAFDVLGSVEQTLKLLPDITVEKIESSCCGMAGAFGYSKETHEVSRQMAELDLLPAVRKANADTLIVADGTSCRHQIADLGDRSALHVARVLAMSLKR